MRGRRSRTRGDDGAAAVEFALVSVLLLTVLFGILQYGIGLWQFQAANATASEAARIAANGINNCTTFASAVTATGAENGIFTPVPAGTAVMAGATFTGPDATHPRGKVLVKIKYQPVPIRFPLVPFPGGDANGNFITGATASVQQLGTVTTTCP